MIDKPFSIIVAYDQNHGIGIGNQLPWHLPKDMAYFKQLTTTAKPHHQNAVIMGRKTWDSIPPKYRPLSNRLNIVISKTLKCPIPTTNETPRIISNFDNTLHNLNNLLKTNSPNDTLLPIDQVFVIGGMSIYHQAIIHPRCEKIYVTKIQHTYNCDAFFPPIPNQFQLMSQSEALDKDIRLKFNVYQLQ